MRATLLHSFYRSKFPSGENNSVLNQAQVLSQYGYEVTLISRSSDDLKSLKKLLTGLNVAFFKGDDPWQEIERSKPDIVHVHNLFPNFGYGWLPSNKFPLVTTFHNFRPFCAAGTFMRENKDCYLCPTSGSLSAVINKCYRESSVLTIPLSFASRNSASENPLLKYSDESVVLSDYAKERYEAFGPQNQKLNVIPNFSFPPKVPVVRDSVEDSWIYVGRLSDEKGIEPLLEHWPDNEILKIFGSGPLENYLKNKNSQRENIIFCGFLDPDQRETILGKSLGLIFPSTCRENSPLILGEAFAAGLPVVAYSANAGAIEILKSGAGHVFHAFEELEISLEWVRLNNARASKAALDFYELKFSPEVWFNNISEVYKRAIG